MLALSVFLFIHDKGVLRLTNDFRLFFNVGLLLAFEKKI